MKLYYYDGFDSTRNFGDELNPFIWKQLMPDALDSDDSSIFVGIGTLLNDKIPPAENTIVMGSGVGYGELPKIDDSWKIYAVRGPMSAQKLGLDKRIAITDPAILTHRLYDTSKDSKIYKFSYMPHWINMCDDWKKVCDETGFNLIDPLSDVTTVLQQISQSEIVITEAMHGAIVADSLRVPWIAVHSKFSDFLPFKWQDWCSSLELNYDSNPITRLWQVDRDFNIKSTLKRALSPLQKKMIQNQLLKISSNAHPNLSNAANFETALSRMEDAVEQFLSDMKKNN